MKAGSSESVDIVCVGCGCGSSAEGVELPQPIANGTSAIEKYESFTPLLYTDRPERKSQLPPHAVRGAGGEYRITQWTESREVYGAQRSEIAARWRCEIWRNCLRKNAQLSSGNTSGPLT